VNDLQHRARHTTGAEDAKALLLGWLKDIGYEQHLFDSEDSEKLATARWSNVLDFVDWIARRCGGEITPTAAARERNQSVLQVAQTISVIISLAERGDEQDVVTLSTLHAAKGLEWPHVVLAGINEGLLPFAGSEDERDDARAAGGRAPADVRGHHARAPHAGGEHAARRRRGREVVLAHPSRFVAEMRLDEVQPREDARERLRRLREELAARTQGSAPAG
jgi:ATP-dependent DNA helicase Rep